MAFRQARDAWRRSIWPTVAAAGSVAAYYFSQGASVPAEYTFDIDPESTVSLDSDTTIAATAAPSMAESGSSAFNIIYENSLKSLHLRGTLHGDLQSAFDGTRLGGPNFSTDITLFTKSAPPWLLLLVVVSLLSILALLYCVHARTRKYVQRVINFASAELPTLELRLPDSTWEYLVRVWDWYCLISAVVWLLTSITPDRVCGALDSTRSVCGQWLLAAILALLFQLGRGPAAPDGPPQVPPETPATDPQLPNNPKRVTVKKTLTIEVVRYEKCLLVRHSVSRPHQTLPRIPWRPCAPERLQAMLVPQEKQTLGDGKDCASQTRSPHREPRDPRDSRRRMKRTFRNALAGREKAHKHTTKELTEDLNVTKAELAAKQEAHQAAAKELVDSHDAVIKEMTETQEAIIKKLAESHKVTKDELAASVGTNVELQDRVKQLTKAHEDVTVELATSNATSNQRLERIKELEAKLNKSEKALLSSQAAQRQAERKFIDESQRTATEMDGMNRLADSHEHLKKENTSLNQAAKEARAKAAKQSQRASDFEKLSNDRQDTIEDLQKTDEDNQKLIETLQDQLKKSDGEVSKLEDTLKKSNANVKELEGNLKVSKSETSNAVIHFNFHKARTDEAFKAQGELQSTLDNERQSHANKTHALEKEVNGLEGAASSSLNEWQKKQEEAVKAAQEQANAAKTSAETARDKLQGEKAGVDAELRVATALIKELREKILELEKRPAAQDLQKPSVSHTTTETDGPATEDVSHPENGQAKPSEPAPPSPPAPVPSSAPSARPEPGGGNTTRPADSTAVRGSTSLENGHDKPAESAPPPGPEAPPSTAGLVLRKSGEGDVPTPTDVTATNGFTSLENEQSATTTPAGHTYGSEKVDEPHILTKEQMASRNRKIAPKKTRLPQASTSTSPPGLSVPSKSGEDATARAPDDGYKKDAVTSERGTGRLPVQSTPIKQPTGSSCRGRPNPPRGKPQRGQSTLKSGHPKPAQSTNLNQAKPGVPNGGTPNGSKAMDGVEKAPAQPTPFVPPQDFKFNLTPELTDLLSQMGPAPSSGTSPSLPRINGTGSVPNDQQLAIDPQLLTNSTLGDAAAVSGKPDAEMEDAENDLPIPKDQEMSDGGDEPVDLTAPSNIGSPPVLPTPEQDLRAVNGNGSGMGGNITANPFGRLANGPSSPLARSPLFPQPSSSPSLPGLGFPKTSGGGLAGSGAPMPTKPSNGSGNAQPAPSAFSPPPSAPKSNAPANNSRTEVLKRLNELNRELKTLHEQKAKAQTDLENAEEEKKSCTEDQDREGVRKADWKVQKYDKALEYANAAISRLERAIAALEAELRDLDAKGGITPGKNDDDDDDDDDDGPNDPSSPGGRNNGGHDMDVDDSGNGEPSSDSQPSDPCDGQRNRGGGHTDSEASVPREPSNGFEYARPALFAGITDTIKRFNETEDRLRVLREQKSDLEDEIARNYSDWDMANIFQNYEWRKNLEDTIKGLEKTLADVEEEIKKLEAEQEALNGQPQTSDGHQMRYTDAPIVGMTDRDKRMNQITKRLEELQQQRSSIDSRIFNCNIDPVLAQFTDDVFDLSTASEDLGKLERELQAVDNEIVQLQAEQEALNALHQTCDGDDDQWLNDEGYNTEEGGNGNFPPPFKPVEYGWHGPIKPLRQRRQAPDATTQQPSTTPFLGLPETEGEKLQRLNDELEILEIQLQHIDDFVESQTDLYYTAIETGSTTEAAAYHKLVADQKSPRAMKNEEIKVVKEEIEKLKALMDE